MKFEDYNPLEEKVFKIMDKKGKIMNTDDMPNFTNDQLLYLYRTMLLSRTMDEKQLSYQRQGRMLTYAPNIGQEATQIGSAYALEKEDWIVPSFRELGAWLIHGVPLKNIFLYWYGNEWGSHMPEDVKVLPVSVPISTQLQHATGIGMANNIKKENNVVLTYTGDGGTSGGEFHEALNFAGVFKAPTIFVIQNNQYAISVPRIEQTASKTLAQKAIAYGIPGIQVDGNDIFAMYVATKEAADRARRGEGPTLIEAITYRLAAHTTSDDPTKYREDAEVEEWKTRDPILRFKTYLENKGILTKEWDEKMKKEVENEITSTFEEIEGKADTKIEEIFMYHYETMPPILEEQLKEYKDFLEGGKNNDK